MKTPRRTGAKTLLIRQRKHGAAGFGLYRLDQPLRKGPSKWWGGQQEGHPGRRRKMGKEITLNRPLEPHIGVFLDDGSVLSMWPLGLFGVFDCDVEDQIADPDIADAIMRDAEALGHSVGHCVALLWSIDPGDAETPSEIEYKAISEDYTALWFGTAKEQADAMLAARSAE